MVLVGGLLIEAYHSIIQRELLEPRQFDSVEHGQEVFERWQQFYNNRRLHGSLKNRTPQYVWKRYEEHLSKAEPLLINTTEALSINRRVEIPSNWSEPVCG